MKYHLKLTFKTPYKIILSRDEHESSSLEDGIKTWNVGWAVIFGDKKTLLINPTHELLDYCKKDDVLIITEDDKASSEKISFGKQQFFHGNFYDKSYIYFKEGILFSLDLDVHRISTILNDLKGKLVLTKGGKFLNEAETCIESLINSN